MHVSLDFRKFYTRLQDLHPFKRREKKRAIVISAPFNFKKEGGIPTGISEDDIQLMREKAAASRIRVADDDDNVPDPSEKLQQQQPLLLPSSRSSSMTLHRPPTLGQGGISGSRSSSFAFRPPTSPASPLAAEFRVRPLVA